MDLPRDTITSNLIGHASPSIWHIENTVNQSETLSELATTGPLGPDPHEYMAARTGET